MTIAIVLLAATLGFQGQTVVQGGPPPKPVPQNAPATLPDTPQGRHVKAFIEAFNSGDRDKFLKTQESLMSSETLAKRSADQRAQMYERLRGDFPTLKIKRAVAEGDQIRLVVSDSEGNDAIFSFDFEPKAPHKIKGIAVDIGDVSR